ncbi:hypothetical protein [Undibacterium flavidum]|uniref:5-bromo-4-chloroindolyl phosphate hydrolysis protein n=1 Tax=Undibacterium flavidum TaxID=2762297 RepID=A0ABR6YDN7_9BURK|nr:hypothetical protein [Undibacterium flavidum]MBC3874653.1 hypothetical protein [Undibacterium flavidum]
MRPSDPKYVASNRPVNSRTWAKKNPSQAGTEQNTEHHKKLRNKFHQRIAKLQNKQQLGPPLLEQLNATSSTSLHQKPGTGIILSSLLCSASALGLLLAAIQKSFNTGIVAGVGLLAGLGMIAYLRSVRSVRSVRQASATLAKNDSALFDIASLQAFDQALAGIADELSDELRAQLIAFKDQVWRLSHLVQQSSDTNCLSLEDRHYLNQSLQRYLPDSLQSYLRIPSALRNTQIIDQDYTAEQLLAQQIQLLQSEFDKYELQLNQSAAEDLIQQQRFLELKSTERDTA